MLNFHVQYSVDFFAANLSFGSRLKFNDINNTTKKSERDKKTRKIEVCGAKKGNRKQKKMILS